MSISNHSLDNVALRLSPLPPQHQNLAPPPLEATDISDSVLLSGERQSSEQTLQASPPPLTELPNNNSQNTTEASEQSQVKTKQEHLPAEEREPQCRSRPESYSAATSTNCAFSSEAAPALLFQEDFIATWPLSSAWSPNETNANSSQVGYWPSSATRTENLQADIAPIEELPAEASPAEALPTDESQIGSSQAEVLQTNESQVGILATEVSPAESTKTNSATEPWQSASAQLEEPQAKEETNTSEARSTANSIAVESASPTRSKAEAKKAPSAEGPPSQAEEQALKEEKEQQEKQRVEVIYDRIKAERLLHEAKRQAIWADLQTELRRIWREVMLRRKKSEDDYLKNWQKLFLNAG